MKKLLAYLIAWGPWGLFLATVLDGAGLTIPGGVDFLIVYLSTRRPDDVIWLALIAVVGSAIGNMVLFSIARKGGQMFLEKRTSSRSGMKFRRWFEHYGVLTVFISALVPLPIMPMKIFVFCSGALGVPPVQFLIAFVGARIPRYLGLAYLGRNMGDNAPQYIKEHVLHLTAFAVALFFVLWVMIRIADIRRARAAAAAGVEVNSPTT